MSVEAKERAFRKAKQLEPEQQAWLAKFIELGQRMPKDRLRIDEYRLILVHLQVERAQLMSIMSGVCKLTVERAEFVSLFQEVLRKSNRVFRDHVLQQKVRDLAQAHKLTTEEILAAHRRLV